MARNRLENMVLASLFSSIRNLSGNPGKGWKEARCPARAAGTIMVEEKEPLPHQKVSSFQGT